MTLHCNTTQLKTGWEPLAYCSFSPASCSSHCSCVAAIGATDLKETTMQRHRRKADGQVIIVHRLPAAINSLISKWGAWIPIAIFWLDNGDWTVLKHRWVHRKVLPGRRHWSFYTLVQLHAMEKQWRWHSHPKVLELGWSRFGWLGMPYPIWHTHWRCE